MNEVNEKIAAHYGSADLKERLLAAIDRLGVARDKLTIDDLAPLDELHVGGRGASEVLAGLLPGGAGRHHLDIGSGLGGPARFFARKLGCRVTGVDLTPSFVEQARMLSELLGIESQVTFHQASATDLPFAVESFDSVSLIHVGMNLPDKAGAMSEAFRVLKPGGLFLIYDVMRGDQGEIVFPMPWAATSQTSFLELPQTYRRLLQGAGFEPELERDRTDEGIAFFQTREKEAAAKKEDVRPPFTNLFAALKTGAAKPLVLLYRKR